MVAVIMLGKVRTMNREELIGKLQMVYVGDKNALNELIGYYDGLKEIIETVQKENQKYKEVIDKAIEYIKEIFYFNEETGEYALLHTFDKCNVKELLDILNEVSK